MKPNQGQYNIEVGEWRLKAAMDIPRKIYSVRLEESLHDYAKEIGGGNLSLGVRLALHRQQTPDADLQTAETKTRKQLIPRAKKKAQPRKTKAAKAKTIRQSLKRKRKRAP